MKKIFTTLVVLSVMILWSQDGHSQLLPDSIITTYSSSKTMKKEFFDFEDARNFTKYEEGWNDTMYYRMFEAYQDSLRIYLQDLFPERDTGKYRIWEYDDSGRLVLSANYEQGELIGYIEMTYNFTDTLEVFNLEFWLQRDTLTLVRKNVDSTWYDSDRHVIKTHYIFQRDGDPIEQNKTFRTVDEKGDTLWTSIRSLDLVDGDIWWDEYIEERVITEEVERSGDTTVTKIATRVGKVNGQGNWVENTSIHHYIRWDDMKGNFGEIHYHPRSIYTLHVQTIQDLGDSTIITIYDSHKAYHPLEFWRDVIRDRKYEPYKKKEVVIQFGDLDEVLSIKEETFDETSSSWMKRTFYYPYTTSVQQDVKDSKAARVIYNLDPKASYFNLNGQSVVASPSHYCLLIEVQNNSASLVLFVSH
jgi:hypothetical protein